MPKRHKKKKRPQPWKKSSTAPTPGSKVSPSHVIPATQRHDKPLKELAVFDRRFAEVQDRTHRGICCVCLKRAYFMSVCQRCHVSKYCDRQCQLCHFILDKQRIICSRNVHFNEARANIPRELKTCMFSTHYHEISTNLCSILRREIYGLVDGQLWRAVLVQPVKINIPTVIVQDMEGNLTTFIFHPPGLLPEGLWNLRLMLALNADVFILLLSGCWNTHADKTAAAVHIVDINQIRIIPRVPGAYHRF